MEKRGLYERARSRLRDRLIRASNVNVAESADPWTDNLAPGIAPKQVEAAYSADPAWREDLALPHSSAALTVNLFAPWQTDLNELRIGDIFGFTGFRFEIETPLGLQGPPAYFDAFGMSGERSIAIEVKCLEYLSEPSEKYRTGFEQSIRQICEAHGSSDEGWIGQANRIHHEPGAYSALFAHQLVKQAFALDHQHKSGKHLLFYLYWEPADWRKHAFFARHRGELDRLSRAVEGERIEFQYLSVNELIAAWARASRPHWLADHVEYLKRRYELEIANGRGT
jgi:hypothetical protein